MDEVETPAARQARQFAFLRRMGNMFMTLAEAHGRAAIAEIENTPKPKSEPEGEPEPAPRRAEKASASAQLFLQTSAAVCQIIALELRLDAGSAPRRSAATRPTPPPDPRRPLLQKIMHDAVRNDPNRARRRREIDENIEQELLADPDGAVLIAETLHAICTRLHIDVELARVPDAFLDYDEPIKTLSRNKSREPPH